MVNCEKCEKVFKTNWHLQRHLSKKLPCKRHSSKDSRDSSKDSQDSSKDSQDSSKDSRDSSKDSRDSSKDSQKFVNYKWCMKTLSSKDHLKKHLGVCKMLNDEIRKLEMDTDTKYTHNPTYCRFCKMTFSKACNLSRHLVTCQSKDIYKMELMAKTKQTVVSNSTINSHNNTINNITNINCIGKENKDYISRKNLIDMYNKCGRCPAKFVGKLIGMTNCNKDHPENHNIVYTNRRGSVAWVKHDDKMELNNVDDAINKWYEGILDETTLEDAKDLQREMKVKLGDLYENDE